MLQKLAYLIVALVLLPLMLATGLAMSPGMDAGYPFLLEIFGGRQSARTIHFITASGIVLFVVVHVVMVLISGVWNNLRSMITGRYVIKEPGSQVMSGAPKVDRRGFLGRGLAIASASLLAGCDSELSDQPWVKRILDSAERLRASPSEHWSRPRRLPANIAKPTSPRTSRRTDRPTSTTTHTGHLPPMGLATGN